MTTLTKRRLGRSALAVTELGLGGAPLGDLFERLEEAQSDAVVQTALAAGLTLFDTAPWYGHGLSEHRLGRVLRHAPRESFVLSTKVGRVYKRPKDPAKHATAPWIGGLPFALTFDYTAAGLIRSYEDSLQRLQLNTVDCLVIHDLDLRFHSETAFAQHCRDLEASGWDALADLRSRKEISAIGVGINDPALASYFIDRFDIDYLLVAMPYTLLEQSALHGPLASCRSRGISVIVGSPYASGILATGPIAGAVYGYRPASPAILEKTARIAALCRDYGTSMRAAALQFPLAHPCVSAVIPGATKADIVLENVAHLRESIPPEFWQALVREGLIDPDSPLPG